MSFTPLSGGTSTALIGAIEPTKFISIRASDDVYQNDPNELYARRVHRPLDRTENMKYTIVIVMISALIFVTVIAIYDVIRNAINNYYANIALLDPNSHNDPDDIERTQIANNNELWSSMVFAAVCLVSAIILIILLIYAFLTASC